MSKRGGKRGERVKGERGRSKRNKERGTKRKERRDSDIYWGLREIQMSEQERSWLLTAEKVV